MKTALFSRIFAFAVVLVLSCSYAIAQSDRHVPLTNAAVVKLVKAGFKEKTIISVIASRPANFDLSTDRMIELKRSGVSEKLILAMLARQEGMEINDEIWADESFMTGGLDNIQKGPGSQSGGNSVDLFGSSGGSRGSTKSRGRDGSASGDTITTGSATVRILRPPTEAGAPAKLEKTPSLTNETVIELVEAGFSEGTIVRRIEQSPVDFDLSPEKLVELRKRRVSEKVLTAMKLAMGEEPGK
jgi:hypothetical protein